MTTNCAPSTICGIPHQVFIVLSVFVFAFLCLIILLRLNIGFLTSTLGDLINSVIPPEAVSQVCHTSYPIVTYSPSSLPSLPPMSETMRCFLNGGTAAFGDSTSTGQSITNSTFPINPWHLERVYISTTYPLHLVFRSDINQWIVTRTINRIYELNTVTDSVKLITTLSLTGQVLNQRQYPAGWYEIIGRRGINLILIKTAGYNKGGPCYDRWLSIDLKSIEIAATTSVLHNFALPEAELGARKLRQLSCLHSIAV